jgi:Gpi18-like mannosyltransferase
MDANLPTVSELSSSAPDKIIRKRSRWIWTLLWSIALAVRVPASFLLPNAERDGYSYAEIIAWLSANLGHLRLADLFGFWLPLFQLTAAIPNVWIHDPLLTGKILSGLSGAASCVLVFAITQKLTRSVALSSLTFVLVVCNPLHILYSAASMTDVPHACLVLASVWFLVQERWLGAAIFAAMAESVRPEAWTFILLLPLLQIIRERRVSLIALGLLVLPPLTWLVICQLATGDPLASFAERVRYNASYLDFNPTRRGFALADINRDAIYFLLGANPIVFLAIIAAAGLSIFQATRQPSRLYWPAAVISASAVALLGFVLLAYVTKRQPVLFPRYGLIFFTLGLPLLAWLLQFDLAHWKRPRIAQWATAATIALCFWQSARQISIIFKVLDDFRAHRQVAQAVAAALQQSREGNSRCFADDAAIRVLSGLPVERFAQSNTTPVAARQNGTDFETYLREQSVTYLVFTSIEDSLPVTFYPQLGQNPEIDAGHFQFLSVTRSSFGPDVWLYRLRGE